MFAEFMIRAFLSGLGVAILTGVLGCFVIWRRMVYFGDALSHAAILGVVGAIALNVSVYFGVIALALILSVLLFTLTSRIQGPMLYWAFLPKRSCIRVDRGKHLGPRIID